MAHKSLQIHRKNKHSQEFENPQSNIKNSNLSENFSELVLLKPRNVKSSNFKNLNLETPLLGLQKLCKARRENLHLLLISSEQNFKSSSIIFRD